MKKYEKFILRIKRTDPNIILCPFPDCEGFIKCELQNKVVGIKLKCEYNHDICTRCGKLWHDEKKCESIINEEIQNMVMSHKLKLKRCPGCEG